MPQEPKYGDKPTPQQAEGIRQLMKMVAQLMVTTKKTNPEAYQRMIAQAQAKRSQ